MVVLLTGAWWVARWIIDSQRVETRQRPIAEAPAAPRANPGAARSATGCGAANGRGQARRARPRAASALHGRPSRAPRRPWSMN